MSRQIEVLKIIRDRVLITHLTPVNREIVDEITIQNTSDKEIVDVILYRLSFMPGLRISDSDGSEIAYYPNDIVEAALSEYAKKDPKWEDLLLAMQEKRIFVLWLRLPEHRAIRPNEARVIRLSYLDREDPAFLRIWRSLFNIPRYVVEKVTPPDEEYDTFYVIRAPLGFTVKASEVEKLKLSKEKSEPLSDADGLHKDLTKSLISIRLPHLESEIRYKLYYDILLEEGERWFFRLLFLVLMTLALVVLSIPSAKILGISLPALFLGQKDIVRLVADNTTSLIGVISAVSFGAISLVTNPLTHRTKLYLLVPVVTAVTAFMVA